MRAVNLIPGDQAGPRIKVGRSGGGAYAVLALLGGLALLVYLYGQASHQISSRHAQIASLEAQVSQAQAQASELTPYTNFVSLREQRVDAVTQLVDSRFNWPGAFYELGRVLPAGASIDELNGTVGASAGSGSSSSTASAGKASGSAISSATPPGSVPSFTLTGCATSQATVALTLERLRLIDGVDEVTLQSSSSAGSSGSSSSSGNCGGKKVTFGAEVVFDALPSASVHGAGGSTATFTSTSGAGSATSAATSSASTGTGAVR
jgi:Tfp pilus assembly protein PilN